MGLRGGRYRQYTLAEKFAARVIVGAPDACWLVHGSTANRAGHVHLSYGSPASRTYRQIYAHVYAWQQAHGRPVPPGLVVMHTCDQPRCCNPAHLAIGTQRENILDSLHKGRYNAFGRQKLDAAKVREIRALRARGWLQKDIARQFGIGRSGITAVLTGASWSHVRNEGQS